jgi:hypothetical protein
MRRSSAQPAAPHTARTALSAELIVTFTMMCVQFGDFGGLSGLIILMWKNMNGWMFPDTRVALPAAISATEKNTRGKHRSQIGNTALVFHNRKLLALMEGSYPFLLKVRA